METQQTVPLLVLMVSLGSVWAGLDGRESGGSEGAQGEGPERQQSRLPTTKAGRCSYTFIVPQQRLTGALCFDSRSEMGVANRSELAALRGELRHQQEQLDRLQGLLERDGGLVGEVRALRGESAGINTRLAQLLQQVFHRQDQALEQHRLESRLLNATAQVVQLTASFMDLEKKYEALTALMNNHSVLMRRLEKQDQPSDTSLTQQEASVPPYLQPRKTSNSIQRDQSLPLSSTLNPTTDQPFISYPVTKALGPWRDCQHAMDSGENTSGIYLLRPRNANRLMQAWCEQDRAQGGWTVIQSRQDGSVNFFRTWEQYKGFGNLDGEYWLGLEHLYWLTTQADYRLRVLLEDWQGRQAFAEYDSFRLEPESDWYRLRLGDYHGNAGDSLSWHNNKPFTTLDRDRDAYTGNCAHYQKGGWWYHMCAHSNLNGVWYRGGHYRSRYQDGVYWAEFHGGSYSLKRVAMLIKPL